MTRESYFCHHHQANTETSNANDEKEDFPAMARVKEFRVHVGNRCCQSLQTNELPQHKNRSLHVLNCNHLVALMRFYVSKLLVLSQKYI